MKNNSTLKYYIGLLMLIIFLISAEGIVAQEKNIYEISSNTVKTKAKVINGKKSVENRQDFYDLAFNLIPTAYLENNTEKKIYGNGNIFKISLLDTKSIPYLISNQRNYTDTEIVVLKVNSIAELNQSFDLTKLTKLSHLKYVYIKCSFKCKKKDIENFVMVNPLVRVFYNAEKPS